VSSLGESVYSFIKKTDVAGFYLINHAHTPFLDWFMPLLSNRSNGGGIWIGIGLIMRACGKTHVRKGALLLLLVLLCSYLMNESLKVVFGRSRPFEALNDVALLVKPMNSLSFPSGHAVAAFSSACILIRKVPKLAWFFLILAVLISFSRIYVGMHYPSDILAGALIGLAFGILLLKLEGKIFLQIDEWREKLRQRNASR
jgi:undecaprenyl-diphosphatase